ncbi:MAG: hypothetical protein ACP5T4_02870 [Candidatus Micrarchaeia archaeon]
MQASIDEIQKAEAEAKAKIEAAQTKKEEMIKKARDEAVKLLAEKVREANEKAAAILSGVEQEIAEEKGKRQKQEKAEIRKIERLRLNAEEAKQIMEQVVKLMLS